MFATTHRAEQHVHTDPMYSAILSRKSLEEFVLWLYENDEDLEIPVDTTLNSLLHDASFIKLVPETLFRNVNLVRKIGNNAAHSSSATTVRDSLSSLKILHDLLYGWYAYIAVARLLFTNLMKPFFRMAPR